MVVNQIHDKYSICSLYAHGDKLLVGLSNGSLQVYSLNDPFARNPKVSLVSTYKGISKKALDKIFAIRNAGLLVVLSGGAVLMLDLDSFSLDEILHKDGEVYTLTTHESAHQLGSESTFVSRLVVSRKKQLVYYEWRDSEFFGSKTAALPDTAHSLTITKDGQSLICGLNSEYVVFSFEENKLSSTILPGSHNATHTDSYATTTSSYFSFTKKNPDLLSAVLSETENILIHDTSYQFVDSAGQLLVEKEISDGVSFELPIKITGYSYPFLICVNSKYLEVRNPLTLTMLQQIDVASITSCTFGKALYVATSKQVFKLLCTSFRAQIEELEAAENYLEAISLLSQIEPVLIDNKEVFSRQLQIKRATQLFKEKKYEESLFLFSDISAAPEDVIPLYPPIVSGRDKDMADAHNDSGPASSDSQNSQETIDKKAITYLLPYLAQTRRKISKLIVSNEQVIFQGYKLSPEIYGDLEVAAEFVDTCLFRCYMLVTPALVGSLVRVHNHCDVKTVTSMLTKVGKTQELIDFYNGKSMHKEALELLRNTPSEGDDENDETIDERIVRYLQRLDNTHLDIILEYSEEPLNQNSLNYGTELFLNESTESRSLDRSRVFKFLHKNPNWVDICIRYLEYVIFDLHDDNVFFHNNLAVLYIKNSEKYGQQLIEFLKQEPYNYLPERVFRELKIAKANPVISEAEAVLWGKKGEHKKALEIYAFTLSNPVKARKYCSDLYSENREEGKSALQTFLLLYLDSSDPSGFREGRETEVLDLLASQGSRMSASEVLARLPPDVRIQSIERFLQSHLRLMTSTVNDELTASSLLKVNLVRTEQSLLQLGQRYTTITKFKTCKHCFKRLGNSVISIFPGGDVVHYGCAAAFKDNLDQQEESRKQVTVADYRHKQRA